MNNTFPTEYTQFLDFAGTLHARAGQHYDNQDYQIHLIQVFDQLYAVADTERHCLLVAGLCHDLLEDTGMTYNDLVKALVSYAMDKRMATKIADVVYDVTNELGKNRKERATKTYPKIAANPLAIIVKLADRIANMKYSQKTQSSMFAKYVQEYPGFKQALFNADVVLAFPEMQKLWTKLDNLVQESVSELRG